MMSPVGVLTVVLGLSQSPQASDSLARDHVFGTLGAQLDAQLTRFAAYGFSGTVLVVRDGRIFLLKGYGLANVERGIPNTAATRFEMNSMTKMFTGAAILQLAADGRVRLSDPVDRYLGAFPPGKQEATLEQLATHTSGLIVKGTELAEDSRDAFIRDVKRTPRESAPGSRYRYTNAGFSLLAAVIEIVSGETYEQYLQRHLFVPAGLRTATFRHEVPANNPLFAHGYVGTPAALEPGPPNPYVWGTKGAGGVWATVGDMYAWLVALEERRILREAQWRVLITPPHPPAREAFGWAVDTTLEGRLRIRKGGGSDDFASQLLYYPREGVVVIWASNNLRQRWRQTLNQAIPATVFGGTPLSVPAVITLAPAALQRLAGHYISTQDTLELRAQRGYLYAAPNRLGVPTNVMFFPQDSSRFTGFDPAARSMTRLAFKGAELLVKLPNGRQVSARR